MTQLEAAMSYVQELRSMALNVNGYGSLSSLSEALRESLCVVGKSDGSIDAPKMKRLVRIEIAARLLAAELKAGLE